MRASSRAWAPGLVALVCMVGLGLGRLHPVPDTSETEARHMPQMSAEGCALLGGLEVGERLMGWTVRALDGPHESMLRIDLERDGVSFALMVAAKGSSPESPPVITERHAIYYGHVQPPETTLPDGTIRATTHALARRIRAQEGTVEVPGM